MEVTTIKIVGTILLWVCMVFFGLLPLRIRHFKTNKTLLAISNCFSGGLFIAIGLIHILPEAHENLEGRRKQNRLSEDEYIFPLSYVICLGTFSFILLVDKVIFNNENIANYDQDKHIDLNKSLFKHNVNENNAEENFKELVSSNYKVALKLSALKQQQESIEEHDEYENFVDDKQESNPHRLEEKVLNDSEVLQEKKSMHSKFHNVFNEEENGDPKIKALTAFEKQHSHEHGHQHKKDHSHAGHQHRMVNAEDSGLTAYILLLAMGIHGFFAGIAFGVSKTNGETINMFIAMIAHKWSEALTVGVSFVSAQIDPKRSAYMIIFLACITPIGVFIGYLISTMSDTIIGIALAISAGTFIYISCAEIIIEEFAISKNKFTKFLFYLLGIVFIGFVGTLEG